jgi:hypothetical protein
MSANAAIISLGNKLARAIFWLRQNAHGQDSIMRFFESMIEYLRMQPLYHLGINCPRDFSASPKRAWAGLYHAILRIHDIMSANAAIISPGNKLPARFFGFAKTRMSRILSCDSSRKPPFLRPFCIKLYQKNVYWILIGF